MYGHWRHLLAQKARAAGQRTEEQLQLAHSVPTWRAHVPAGPPVALRPAAKDDGFGVKYIQCCLLMHNHTRLWSRMSCTVLAPDVDVGWGPSCIRVRDKMEITCLNDIINWDIGL